ncbi:hypothetical protein ACFLU6_03715, partial [Acidobacteriota bacterium]
HEGRWLLLRSLTCDPLAGAEMALRAGKLGAEYAIPRLVYLSSFFLYIHYSRAERPEKAMHCIKVALEGLETVASSLGPRRELYLQLSESREILESALSELGGPEITPPPPQHPALSG